MYRKGGKCMENEKIENLLNLALDATKEEREKSLNLEVGYEPEENTWELIIKFDQEAFEMGKLEGLEGLIPLSFGYGIIRIPEKRISELAALPQVQYIEKPKQLFFAVNRGKADSCFLGLPETEGTEGDRTLEGQGVIVAVLDSGVDYFHPDFRNQDGTTRILSIWDQTADTGSAPEGFQGGTEFSREAINAALARGSRPAGYEVVPSIDGSGHGTAVLGIAAGNGNASGGRFRGGAPKSDLLVVKLGTPGEGDFPRTTQLMQGLEYVIRTARKEGKPVAVNLSFGNVYGSHTGTSLLETYMNEMAGVWKNVIVTGAGNEGEGRGHVSGNMNEEEIQETELAVAAFEPTLNLQLWKNYGDEMELALIHPKGQRVLLQPSGRIPGDPGISRYRMGNTEILVYYGVPVPYSTNQEIYLDFLPVGKYIDSGIWKLELTPGKIRWGAYDMWLPGQEVLNEGTGFLRPSPQVTLTIPSTAEKVITVGAYDSSRMAYAAFSGRGYTRYPEKIKPDLSAPGVNITAPAAGGGYAPVTGTSFAAPFVTAASALLMQWGITAGNDPYLYGEKVKAYLQKGARILPGFDQWPNDQVGWGALCVRDSIPD